MKLSRLSFVSLLLISACFVRSSVIKRFSVWVKSSVADEFSHCIGIKCKDGCLIGTIDSPVASSTRWLKSPRKLIVNIGMSIVAFAGITADIEFIVRAARDIKEDYRNSYGRTIPGAVLADKLSAFLYLQTFKEASRPLGIACIVVTENDDLLVLKGNAELRAYNACTTLSKPPEDLVLFLKSEDWTQRSCGEVEVLVRKFFDESESFQSQHVVHTQLIQKSRVPQTL
jgi:hypothetical protein